MGDTNTGPEGAEHYVAPDPPEALARLDMPMQDAMRTQRAIRRLHTTPVSHEVLLPLLELSLKAPTSSNTQDWCYMVIEDREQKARLAKLHRRLYRLYNPIVERQARATRRRCGRSARASGRPSISRTFPSS